MIKLEEWQKSVIVFVILAVFVWGFFFSVITLKLVRRVTQLEKNQQLLGNVMVELHPPKE